MLHSKLIYADSHINRTVRYIYTVKYLTLEFSCLQGEEKISYSLLKPIDQDMKVQSQRVIVIIIEHTMVRQTTVMMATLCQSSQFLLKLTENPECKDNARDTYNPFGVCPAYCPL